MNILITGFDPFGGEKVNPALEAVKTLPSEIKGHQIDKLEIPTVFNDSIEVIKSQLEKKTYDIIIAVGQAGGRYEITPERVAINVDDARIPDNQGNQPIDQRIQDDGAPAYFTNLPVKRMVEAMRNAQVPASLSNSAGTFVCNHIMYQLAYLAAHLDHPVKTGFIHVPFAPEQVVDKPNQPSMAIEVMTKGLRIAIETSIEYDGDVEAVLGTTH
ncbi:pyroglutamyl-peptidase I [Staphylococcus canis]|uniref:Pyrrolidone-carboxylate peptidase n=1 Tax=Staphylococcus canis TaxID=2724942 RepID=A0ABS0T772_9STAP|nr:pyroglutamyl-peptidase I [Staphylococcus canis]MBI5974591.1 pyroglutamyl-peptidase I [Staphylococcus canis]